MSDKTNRNGHKQYAAIPYRQGAHGFEVLLITSRETHRWVIPKGWPEKALAPHEVAEREAFEEAGLKGQVNRRRLASFTYLKRLPDNKRRRCTVEVFLMAVEQELSDWPEKKERHRCWMSPETAAEAVAEAGLATIFRHLVDTPEKTTQTEPRT